MAIGVVTGTSSGIGLATAVTLARAGHTVVATMRNLNRSGDLQTIISDEKLPIKLAKLDVDDDASVSDAFNKVFAEHGRIDVLVNNAGVPAIGSIEETPIATFRETMETNFFGGLRCIKAVVPVMRERRHGCIVSVTSLAGRTAIAPLGPYAVSKWAFEALNECLAQEMKAFNVRVAIIEPGVIATPILGKATPAPANSPLSASETPCGPVQGGAQLARFPFRRRRTNQADRRWRQLAAPLSRRGGCGRPREVAIGDNR